MTPKQRQKQLRAILVAMGGRLNGNNNENYTRIAWLTKSSVSTVKAWVGGYRVIPEVKLERLK